MFEREKRWWIAFGVLFSILLTLAPNAWGQQGTEGSPASIMGSSPERSRSEYEPYLFVYRLEVKTMSVTLENAGDHPGLFMVNAAIDYKGHEDDGWGVDFDGKTVFLEMREAVEYMVPVTGPSTGHPNDIIRVCLELRDPEAGHTLISSSCFYAQYVVPHCSHKLDASENVLMTPAGTPVVFNITVENPHDSSFNVTIAIKDRPEGWDVVLSQDKIEPIGPYEVVHMTITVTPPLSAYGNEVGSVYLRAFRPDLPQLMDELAVHTIVQPEYSLWLTSEDQEMEVEVGGTAQYQVIVNQVSNLPDPVIFVMELMEKSSDWFVEFDRTALSMMGTVTQVIKVDVTAPEGARPGDKSIIRLEGSAKEATVTDDIVLITTVMNPKPVHDLELNLTPKGVEANPGSRASFLLQIRNTGNVPEAVGFEPTSVPEAWSMEFPEIGAAVPAEMLEPGSEVATEVRISVPGNAVPGKYQISGIVTSVGTDVSVPFDIIITVPAVFAIDIASKSMGALIEPGDAATFEMAVTNIGNFYDYVSLYVPDIWIPADWTASFTVPDGALRAGQDDTEDKMTFGIPPGETSPITMTVQVPADEDGAGNRILRVVAESLNGPKDEVDVTVTVGIPVLVLGDITIGERDDDGQETVTVVLGNEGNVACEDIRVTMYDNGVPVNFVDVNVVNPGKEVDVVFTWNLGPGDHWLNIRAESPRSEADPVGVRVSYPIGDKDVRTMDGPSLILMSLPIDGMVALFAFMAIVILKGRDDGERTLER